MAVRRAAAAYLAFRIVALLVIVGGIAATAGAAFGWSIGWFSWGCAAAMAIGGAVGMVELLGRYRYAPLRALFTGSGLSYVGVNVASAAAAFYMLGQDAFPEIVSSTGTRGELIRTLLAGFGALVVLRSSVFKVRVGDVDVGIGPAAILDVLLLVADRGVDRHEAVYRATEVTDLIAETAPAAQAAAMLTAYCLALMQNVPPDERSKIEKAIDDIMGNAKIPESVKMDVIALTLSNTVGPDVLEAAILALGERLKAVPEAPPGGQAAAPSGRSPTPPPDGLPSSPGAPLPFGSAAGPGEGPIAATDAAVLGEAKLLPALSAADIGQRLMADIARSKGAPEASTPAADAPEANAGSRPDPSDARSDGPPAGPGQMPPESPG